MEYYLHLAREQYDRFKQFESKRPDEHPFTVRTAFFGQRYEASIAKSIIEGISECEKYNENHPVKV